MEPGKVERAIEADLAFLASHPMRRTNAEAMARIARELAANAKIDDDELIFAIGHAAAMLKTLQSDYYAAWHNEKPLDP